MVLIQYAKLEKVGSRSIFFMYFHEPWVLCSKVVGASMMLSDNNIYIDTLPLL
jgi:hypothetical protein